MEVRKNSTTISVSSKAAAQRIRWICCATPESICSSRSPCRPHLYTAAIWSRSLMNCSNRLTPELPPRPLFFLFESLRSDLPARAHDGAFQMGAAQVCTGQLRVAQLRAEQHGAVQHSSGQVRAAHI